MFEGLDGPRAVRARVRVLRDMLQNDNEAYEGEGREYDQIGTGGGLKEEASLIGQRGMQFVTLAS